MMFSAVQCQSKENDLQRQRHQMVQEQIVARGVKNPSVLEAMKKVERHRFMDSDMQPQAYEDHPLPIGWGQTISQPFIVASMTERLQPKPTDRILEIGTGSGYQAAVLAEIVKEVYTIEIIDKLGQQAQRTLKNLGYQNIHVRIGDGFGGWPDKGPFDGILVTAAPDKIPEPLFEQLKPGGRMIIPVGKAGGIQELMLVEKDPKGQKIKKSLYPVRFVPLTRKES